MGRTKKTNSETNIEKVISQETKQVKEIIIPVVEKSPRIVDKDDYVDVMNNTIGTLSYYNPRTTGEWLIEGYGTTDTMQVSDLITMKSSQSKILNEGWLIILDEDVVNYLRLTELYKKIIKPNDLDRVFGLPDDKMESILQKSPNGIKTLIAQKMIEKIKSGKFDSLNKKKIVEKVLNVKLDDYIE